VRYAADAGSDLIVLATHRVGAQRPEGALGTLSHQVALLAGCSVLLVRAS
jgi:nucleotide-binding universal stress UspA family protein